jgi:NAD(P)-dependent dehydrogenase (short-subunit alcohol dehydrogenase family)
VSSAKGRKAVFITGAASGIGLASAKRFAAEGWFVGLSDIDVAGLKAALAAVGPDNGATFRLDVRDRVRLDLRPGRLRQADRRPPGRAAQQRRRRQASGRSTATRTPTSTCSWTSTSRA